MSALPSFALFCSIYFDFLVCMFVYLFNIKYLACFVFVPFFKGKGRGSPFWSQILFRELEISVLSLECYGTRLHTRNSAVSCDPVDRSYNGIGLRRRDAGSLGVALIHSKHVFLYFIFPFVSFSTFFSTFMEPGCRCTTELHHVIPLVDPTKE